MACEHNLSFLESEDLQKAITQWQEWDTNSKDKEELDGLIEAKDMRTLRAYFTQRCVRKRKRTFVMIGWKHLLFLSCLLSISIFLFSYIF